MAGKAGIKTLQRKSRIAALEGLQKQSGFPVPPRKAMAQVKKKSKGLAYPLPPFAGANLLVLYQWARGEWVKLGRHKKLALPIAALVAITTWEKENALREARWDEIEREETIHFANDLYLKATAPPTEKKKKGFWPFKRKAKNE